MYRMDRLTHLSSFLERPDPSLLTPAALRLARHIPAVRDGLDACLQDPIHRALVGLDVLDPCAQTEVTSQVLATVAVAEGGGVLPVAWLEQLEEQVSTTHLDLWPLAARAHVLLSPERERRARIMLSAQDLPYAFPGELNATQVALFAAGDRVLPALHVDWIRKLTELACEALVADVHSQGLWAWPALQVMEPRKVVQTLRRALRRARIMPPGTKGLMVAYLEQVGVQTEVELGRADALLLDLTRATQKRTDR